MFVLVEVDWPTACAICASLFPVTADDLTTFLPYQQLSHPFSNRPRSWCFWTIVAVLRAKENGKSWVLLQLRGFGSFWVKVFYYFNIFEIEIQCWPCWESLFLYIIFRLSGCAGSSDWNACRRCSISGEISSLKTFGFSLSRWTKFLSSAT